MRACVKSLNLTEEVTWRLAQLHVRIPVSGHSQLPVGKRRPPYTAHVRAAAPATCKCRANHAHKDNHSMNQTLLPTQHTNKPWPNTTDPQSHKEYHTNLTHSDAKPTHQASRQ